MIYREAGKITRSTSTSGSQMVVQKGFAFRQLYRECHFWIALFNYYFLRMRLTTTLSKISAARLSKGGSTCAFQEVRAGQPRSYLKHLEYVRVPPGIWSHTNGVLNYHEPRTWEENVIGRMCLASWTLHRSKTRRCWRANISLKNRQSSTCGYSIPLLSSSLSL